ncbi:MAG: hypothetical protein H7222_03850 [Methylotenera sp.]|nr:hypothetical protein [Oligoflexia bacterium]
MSLKIVLSIAALASSSSIAAFGASDRPVGVHWAGYPIGNYTSDQGVTLGLLGRRFDYGDSGVKPFKSVTTFQASHATHGSTVIQLEFEETGVTEHDLRFTSALTAQRNENQRYYGLGDQTLRNTTLERQNFYYYEQELLTFENAVRKKIESLGWDIQLGIAPTLNRSRSLTTAQSGPTLFQNEYGSSRKTSYYTTTHLRFIRDRRDSEFVPSRGSIASAALSHSPRFLGQLPAWSRIDLDYRRYDSFIDGRKLWLATQARMTSSSNDAPLVEKARLGSLGTLRGLPLNRYLSNDSLSLRSELRSIWYHDSFFDLPLKLGTGVFIDTGKIASSVSQLTSSSFHSGYGCSLFGSYFTDDFVGSTNIAFSEGATALYLILGFSY